MDCVWMLDLFVLQLLGIEMAIKIETGNFSKFIKNLKDNPTCWRVWDTFFIHVGFIVDRTNCFQWQKPLDILKNFVVVSISAVPNNPTIGFTDTLRLKPSSFPKLINKSVDLGIIDMMLV